jgi:hypothetical protein
LFGEWPVLFKAIVDEHNQNIEEYKEAKLATRGLHGKE